jgi:RND family efflux transporter MFP subunit
MEQKDKANNAARKRWIIVSATVVLVATVSMVLFFTRGASRSSSVGAPVPEPSVDPFARGGPTTTPQPGEMVITLPADKFQNAQIKTEEAKLAQRAASSSGLRTTGTVQANAYKEVPVLPISGGRVREVRVELGDQVRAGQALAVIFSTELAEAQTEYLKMSAELEEHHQHHLRTVELVELGAASREEMEQATARYKGAKAEVAAARQKLLLLGMSDKQIDALAGAERMSSLVTVDSPAAGTVIARQVNVGEVVMEGKELFRIADLSTVWVMGQIYESDFAGVRVGTPATITTSAYPGRSFTGRVSYIDPRVDSQTRTAQMRVEVVNPGGMLRLGMFVDMTFGQAAQSGAAVVVPRSAVQSLGAKQVVYVATDQPGVFVQRDVVVGSEADGLVPIYSGVSAGEMVVTEGSFLLRAESFKLNSAQIASPPAAPSAMTHQQHTTQEQSVEETRSLRILVSEKGFEPATIRLKRNVTARLTFVRKIEVTCATEIVIKDFGIKQELPLNEPVTIEIKPDKAGEFPFSCGMNMVSGKLVVR